MNNPSTGTTSTFVRTWSNFYEVNKELEVGAKVKIVSGPFSGMIGTIDSLDLPNKKVNLLVDLFGQETSVEVGIS